MQKFKIDHILKSYKRKIGIMSEDFGPTDCNFYAINMGNKVVESTNIDVVGFYENLPNPVVPANFGFMNIQDIWGFDGLTIATNINQALALKRVPGHHPKIFYVWDLEFLRGQNRNFLYNLGAYRSNLKIVCRSEEHAKCFKNYANRDVDSIIEYFNLFEFWKQFGENHASERK